MTQEQFTAVLRQILLVGSGFFIGKGYLSTDTWNVVMPAVVALATAGFGIYARRKTGLISSAVSLSDVKSVTLENNTIIRTPGELKNARVS